MPGKLGSGAGYVRGEQLWQHGQPLQGELTQFVRLWAVAVASGRQQCFHFRQLALTLRNRLQQERRVTTFRNSRSEPPQLLFECFLLFLCALPVLGSINLGCFQLTLKLLQGIIQDFRSQHS